MSPLMNSCESVLETEFSKINYSVMASSYACQNNYSGNVCSDKDYGKILEGSFVPTIALGTVCWELHIFMTADLLKSLLLLVHTDEIERKKTYDVHPVKKE